ncbi:hypothetical protein G7046_g2510 [Stylonectria norvegica]|nr:hypothetical protein G7046_g2510 [Stylonectria norvegica]
MLARSPNDSGSQSSSRPSGRKGSKKVRTGCITCKIRKVKCDEEKPHCRRCVKTGRTCDGYRQASSSPNGLAISQIPGFESIAETRAFDYYRQRSAGILSGTLDAGFWTNLVLRMSSTEPAVRHAMLAVSSLHECVEVKRLHGRELSRQFAFQEYGQAITSLRDWAKRDEPSTIPLLVCLLFICFEFLADREAASQMHICQGRKILSGLGDESSPDMELIKQHLVPIYARLSMASFLYGSRPTQIPRHLTAWAEIPAVFASLDEARCVLHHEIDEGLQFTTRASISVYALETDPLEMMDLQFEQHQLLARLGRWHSAFTVLVSMSPQSTSLAVARDLLRIWYYASRIWLSTALAPYEVAYDAHVAAFASIISLASSILDSPTHTSKTSAFCFETELVAPVYWTATKCRHPLLRRAALKLLTRDKMLVRRENLWHVNETIVIASRVIELEEEGMELAGGCTTNPLDPMQGLNDYMKLEGRRPGFVREQTGNTEEINIPLTRPPSFCPRQCGMFADLVRDDRSSSDSSSDNTSLPTSRETSSEPFCLTEYPAEPAQSTNLTIFPQSNLESPFGLPESRRVKNATIGPREEHGVWATFFRDPNPGETQWKVTKEFLRCRVEHQSPERLSHFYSSFQDAH